MNKKSENVHFRQSLIQQPKDVSEDLVILYVLTLPSMTPVALKAGSLFYSRMGSMVMCFFACIPQRNDFLLCFQQASWNSFSSGQCLPWDGSLICRQEDYSSWLSQGSTSGAFPEPSWWEPAGKCARNEFWELTTIAMPCLPHHLLYSSVFSACFDNQESQDGLWVESVKVWSSFC